MNELLNFMNENHNWREVLAQAPYNFTISNDGIYTMVKYSKAQPDFSNPIAQQARGAIFYQEDGYWKYVCRPYDKFGNYREEYAATDKLDWNHCYVREKVDGSLIKIWWSPADLLWHVSTNGTIDANKAYVNDTDWSFFDYFILALGGHENFNKLLGSLNIYYTYMFELVGPHNKIVVDYAEPAVYLLAARHIVNGHIVNDVDYLPLNDLKDFDFLHHPQIYPLNTLEDCLSIAEKMDAQHEGFVVNDAHGNMIKVKSTEYLLAARVHNNGILTAKRALEIIQNNMVDDFMAYATINHQNKMKTIQSNLDYLCYVLYNHGRIKECGTRKDYYFNLSNHINNANFSSTIKKTIIAYGMAYYDDNNLNPYDFLMKNSNKLADIIEEMLEAK